MVGRLWAAAAVVGGVVGGSAVVTIVTGSRAADPNEGPAISSAPAGDSSCQSDPDTNSHSFGLEGTVRVLTGLGGVIFLGEVQEIRDPKWTTSSGASPTPYVPHGDNPVVSAVPYRIAVVQVTELIAGDDPGGTVTLSLAGDPASNHPQPRVQGRDWRVGCEVLVLGLKSPPQSRLAGAEYNTQEGSVIANGQVTIGEETLTLADARTRIEAEVARQEAEGLSWPGGNSR